MFRNRQVYPTGKGEIERGLFVGALADLRARYGGKTYPHVLAGKKIHAQSGATYDSVDPNNTADVVARFPQHDVGSAIECALLHARLMSVALAQERWWKTPYQKRIEVVEALAELLRDRTWLFVAAMALEGGKRPFPNGFGEMQEAIEFPLHNIELAKQLYTSRSPRMPKWFCDINGYQFIPNGPIVDIEPFNFALAIPMDKISSALLTGNAIIMKASGHTPLIGYLLYRTVQDAFDAVGSQNDGVVNFLSGHGGDMAGFLLASPCVNGYTFTGSRDAFWQIQHDFESTPRVHGGTFQRIAAETSGRNPMVVWNDADVERAVGYAVASLINNDSQTCSHLGDLVLHTDIEEEFMREFKRKLDELTYGDIKDLGNACGALISAKNVTNYESAIAGMAGRGLAGLEYVKAIDSRQHAFDFAPRILRATSQAHYDTTLLHELRSIELFAPAATVWTVETKERMKSICEAGVFKLTAGIFTDDIEMAQYFVRDVRCGGQKYINCGVTGALVGTAFGGDALSGSSADGVGASTEAALRKYVTHVNVSACFSSGQNAAQRIALASALEESMAINPSVEELVKE